jgi:putative NADH-flavin reductase
MNLLVFGASGATGRLVIAQARAADHAVTAFARDPASLTGEGVRVIAGDATDTAAVAVAMAGHDAVICTLGVRNALRSGHLIERALSAIVPAMDRAGARRLVVMSALGVGTTRAQAPWLPRLMYALLLRDIFGDKAAGERIVCASALDWTIVYPPLLTNGAQTASYRAGETLAMSGFPAIARADVAHFMVGALASPEWVRKRVIVSA